MTTCTGILFLHDDGSRECEHADCTADLLEHEWVLEDALAA